MPSQPDNNSPKGEERTPSQLSKTFRITFLEKMAITARLMGKEIHRNRLRWFDLRRADHRLGEKASAEKISLSQTQFLTRVEQLRKRLTTLWQRSEETVSTVGEKAKKWVKLAARNVQATVLEARLRGSLIRLGAAVRRDSATHTSLKAEVELANSISNQIGAVDAEIGELRSRTYPWAGLRKKSLLACLSVVALTSGLAVAGAEQQTGTSDLSTPKKAVLAFETALARNDLAEAKALALGSDQQVVMAKMKSDGTRALSHVITSFKKVFPKADIAQFPDNFEVELAKEVEQVDGNHATVGSGFNLLVAVYKLEKSGPTWRVDLRETRAASTEDSSLEASINNLNRFANDIEQGRYGMAKEKEAVVEFDKLVRNFDTAERPAPVSATPGNLPVAAKAPEKATQTRSEDSLAVERYLRSRLVGGLTENQIIELSDSIAAKFDAADLPAKEREWCFWGKGDKRKIALCKLDDFRSSSSLASPEAKRAAKQLMEEIMHMIPTRAVFSGLFSNSSSERPVKSFPVETPLPPIDSPIGHGYRPAGALVRERLQSLETVIRIMSDDNRTADRAFDMVKSLGDQANDSSLEQYRERGPAVLVCGYQGGFKDTSWKRLFWYKKDPDGLAQLLKTLPADHPIRQIGPIRDSAPATLELALQANPHSADQLLKEIAEEKERAERPPPGPELTNAEKFWIAIGAVATAAIVSERILDNQAEQQRARVRKIVEESGGTKMECPKCNGSGKIFYSTYDTRANPYPWYALENKTFEQQRETMHTSRCDRCGGTGIVNK
jgi:hypothetical protein